MGDRNPCTLQLRSAIHFAICDRRHDAGTGDWRSRVAVRCLREPRSRIRVCSVEQFNSGSALPLVDVEQDSGRPWVTTTVTSIPAIATLDVRLLSPAQHEAAKSVFDALADQRFLPFDQVDEDEARAELDRRLIVDVLGLSQTLCDAGGPIERLRRKLAAEPQIHANKRTRLVFTADGETSVRRTDRR